MEAGSSKAVWVSLGVEPRVYRVPFMCKGKVMNTHWRWLAGPILLGGLSARLWAGGSGLNIVVVVNQHSTNSVQLGNYYCEQRQVPPQNVLKRSEERRVGKECRS